MSATPLTADRVPRLIRLSLKRIPVLPCVRTAAVVGVFVGLLVALAVLALWVLVTRTGTVTQLASLVATSSSSQAAIAAAFSLPTALGVAAIAGVITALQTTALAAVAALMFNAAARLMGGLGVFLAQSDTGDAPRGGADD